MIQAVVVSAYCALKTAALYLVCCEPAMAGSLWDFQELILNLLRGLIRRKTFLILIQKEAVVITSSTKK